MKKLLLWGLPLLCLAAGCREQPDETPDERSIAYNDRAIALMQDYLGGTRSFRIPPCWPRAAPAPIPSNG